MGKEKKLKHKRETLERVIVALEEALKLSKKLDADRDRELVAAAPAAKDQT